MALKPEENEFYAENEIVSIIPKFQAERIYFASGTFGPFRPPKPAQVPLWLAVYLRKLGQCEVQLPLWLDYEVLKSIKTYEDRNERFCDDLPYYYYEIAFSLFNNCAEDFKEVARVQSLVEDIHQIRKEKLKLSLRKADTSQPCEFLGKPGACEINLMRPAFPDAFGIQ